MERKAFDYYVYGAHGVLIGKYEFLFATDEEMLFQATGIYQGVLLFKKKVKVEVFHKGELVKVIGNTNN